MLAIYTRLSVDDEASNSIANQLHEGSEFAKKHDFKEPLIYNEGMGISGRANIIDRPKLSDLIQDIEAGKITTVWVRHQNRIERNGETFHILADALKRNKVMIWYGDTKSDYNDAGDYFHSSIISAVNQYHANLISQQIKKTLHSKAKQGKSTGNYAYGYMSDEDKNIVVNPETSKVVRQIFQDYCLRMGTVSIAEKLNKNNVPTFFEKSKRWYAAAVNGIIKNTAYIGKKKFGNEFYDCPAIISKATFDKAQSILKERGVLTQNRSNREYLLSGLIKCGVCGRNFVGRKYSYKSRRNKVYHYYRCGSTHHRNDSCGNKPIKQEVLEDFIWDVALDHDKLFERVKESLEDTSNKKRLEQKVIDNNNKLQNLDTEWKRVRRQGSKGILTDDEMIEEKTRIDRERENVLKDIDFDEEELHRIKMGNVIWETEYFEGMTHIKMKKRGNRISTIKSASKNERKRIIHELIRDITIGYEDKYFSVEVRYNLPIESNTYKIDRNYFASYLNGSIISWIAPDLTKTGLDKATRRLKKERNGITTKG